VRKINEVCSSSFDCGLENKNKNEMCAKRDKEKKYISKKNNNKNKRKEQNLK
jgi:hypothetical protein